MATYTGGLAENGLPELRDEGEVSEPSMTLRGVQRVMLTDADGVPVASSDSSDTDGTPGDTPDVPLYVANPDGQNLRVRVEGEPGVKLTDGIDVADVFDLTNANPLAVAIVDSSGNQITSFSSTVADTELPAAAVLADGTSNPTAPAVGAFGHVWNGATWDRTPGNATDGTLVNLGANNDVTVTSGSVTVSDGGGSISVDDNGGSLTIDNAALSVTGGGVEASALRVTIASDSTGVLSVDDNGGNLSIDDGGNSITVDGSVTVTQATGTNLHAVVDSGTITTITNVVHVDDNSGSLTVDNAALSVTGGGVESSALRVTIANDSTGVLSVDDNGGSLTVDGAVTVTPNAIDDAAFTPAVDPVTVAAATFDDVQPDSVDEGDKGALRMSGRRELYVQLRDAAGNERGLQVDSYGRLAVTLPTPDPVDPEPNIVVVDGTVATMAKQATANAQSALTISTTAQRIVSANAARLALLICNNGAGTLYVGNTSSVTTSGATMGVLVPPKGRLSDIGDGVYVGELWGIYSAAATTQNVVVWDCS